MPEPKTEARPFDYLIDPPLQITEVVQVYTRDPQQPERSLKLAAAIWDPALVEAVRALPELVGLLSHIEGNLRTYQDDIRRSMNAAGLTSEFGEILDVGMRDVVDDAELRRTEIQAVLAMLARLATGDGGGA